MSLAAPATRPSGRPADARARRHPAYWAFLLHRLSGIALALFLPLHFALLARALQGEAALDAALRWTELAPVKFAEWGLVVLLSLHAAGGVRLLLIEFRPWAGPRAGWIAGAAGFAVFAGMVFALALIA